MHFSSLQCLSTPTHHILLNSIAFIIIGEWCPLLCTSLLSSVSSACLGSHNLFASAPFSDDLNISLLFWTVTPCRRLYWYQCKHTEDGDIMFLRNDSTRRRNPEQQHCHPYRRENLKSHSLNILPPFKARNKILHPCKTEGKILTFIYFNFYAFT
jgi:hypothetical protein